MIVTSIAVPRAAINTIVNSCSLKGPVSGVVISSPSESGVGIDGAR